eukprot:jgi/Tetstr1/433112/TSEL_022444.t1
MGGPRIATSTPKHPSTPAAQRSRPASQSQGGEAVPELELSPAAQCTRSQRGSSRLPGATDLSPPGQHNPAAGGQSNGAAPIQHNSAGGSEAATTEVPIGKGKTKRVKGQ